MYRARHVQLNKAFALKIISPAFALDAALRARFIEEAKLASEISHPNIVSVVDYGEDADLGAFMVMELVDGEPLCPTDGAPMTVRRACEILAQVADALEHIHRRGIVHGDVKAENILLVDETVDGRKRRGARLLDFGLARRAPTPGAVGETEESISGSPHYLAPERALGGPPTIAADVYALGVLGYQMLAGALPFEGGVVEVLTAHVHEPAPPIVARRRESVDPALEALIARALAKEPARRHATAAAFRYELNTVMDMLDLRRRSSGTIRPDGTASREGALVAAFDRSKIPQALCAADGRIVHANKAFVAMVKEPRAEGMLLADTSLAAIVFAGEAGDDARVGLAQALDDVQRRGKPIERRVHVPRGDRPPLELIAWLAPLPVPGLELHVIVRVTEIAPAS